MNPGRKDSGIFEGSERPRILFAGVNWLGDALFSTPALRAIKKRYPQSYLAYLADPRVAPVIERNPYADQMISFTERPALWGAPEWTRLVLRLKALRFDAVFFAHRSLTRAMACAAAGIPLRAGYAYPKRNFCLNRFLRPPVSPAHRAQMYLSVVEGLGIPSQGLEPDWRVRPEDRVKVREQIGAAAGDLERRYALLHPGANWDLKRWPVARFAELAAGLKTQGFEVWVAGSPSDRELGEVIAQASGARNVCGRTDLFGLAALMEGASVLVSADSGPLHLAGALGTPAVGLFGPTDPILTGPHSRGALRMIHRRYGCEVPCYFGRCEDRVCMEGILTEVVLAEALAIARPEVTA